MELYDGGKHVAQLCGCYDLFMAARRGIHSQKEQV